MIQVTRINHVRFFLNPDLIEFIDTTPDTVITTVKGTKMIVAESPEEVVERIVDYRRRIGAGPQATEKAEDLAER